MCFCIIEWLCRNKSSCAFPAASTFLCVGPGYIVLTNCESVCAFSPVEESELDVNTSFVKYLHLVVIFGGSVKYSLRFAPHLD